MTTISKKCTNRTLLKIIARRVRYYRAELNIPRRVLADKTKISDRYIAQLEAGKANISILLLQSIANALDVDIEVLVQD